MIPAYTSNARFVPALTGIRRPGGPAGPRAALRRKPSDGLQFLVAVSGAGLSWGELFFILSGFILTHVYLASVAGRQPNAIAIFLWHRFIRLYPVHLTVLAVLAAIVYLAQSRGVVLNSAELERRRTFLASHAPACMGHRGNSGMEYSVLVHQRGMVRRICSFRSSRRHFGGCETRCWRCHSRR